MRWEDYYSETLGGDANAYDSSALVVIDKQKSIFKQVKYVISLLEDIIFNFDDSMKVIAIALKGNERISFKFSQKPSSEVMLAFINWLTINGYTLYSVIMVGKDGEVMRVEDICTESGTIRFYVDADLRCLLEEIIDIEDPSLETRRVSKIISVDCKEDSDFGEIFYIALKRTFGEVSYYVVTSGRKTICISEGTEAVTILDDNYIFVTLPKYLKDKIDILVENIKELCRYHKVDHEVSVLSDVYFMN